MTTATPQQTETNKTETKTTEINIASNKNRIVNELDFCPIKLRFISLVHSLARSYVRFVLV